MEVIPSKFSSQFDAIIDPKTYLEDKVPATLINALELAFAQPESAVSRLVELKGEKDRPADHVWEPKSKKVKLKAKSRS